MWDRILSALAILLLILAGVLLLSSGINRFYDLTQVIPLSAVHHYGGLGLIGSSVLIVLCNIIITRHPLFEYWILAMVGFIVGVVYVV